MGWKVGAPIISDRDGRAEITEEEATNYRPCGHSTPRKAELLTIKQSGGLWFVLEGRLIVSPPYASETYALSALDRARNSRDLSGKASSSTPPQAE